MHCTRKTKKCIMYVDVLLHPNKPLLVITSLAYSSVRKYFKLLTILYDRIANENHDAELLTPNENINLHVIKALNLRQTSSYINISHFFLHYALEIYSFPLT